MTVWSPWVDAKYSPSAENASAIVDFAVSGRGMYEADLPEPYMSSRLQSSRSLRLRPVSSRWNSSECTPARRRGGMLDDMHDSAELGTVEGMLPTLWPDMKQLHLQKK